ncbi:MAG: O-antigen ligase family protein [Flavobacteriales bacterium]|jgi:putative inorganic carbon (HCO3(-)) transporter|nr:O-antigen ligase family protein [Flavobacteriales bacterium]MBK9512107.1 O-antigen ligase family protein [Flavobacteriales bacterium]MBP7450027.1 O-antigen ligase family protein [Flavobacteriales bacterium]HOZ41351.1 O-antigen ligase family protein [Flavobacteriales bacterium]
MRLLKEHWVFMASIAFVVLNAAFMAGQIYWFSVLPAVLLIVWAMLTAVDRLIYFIAFATPLSINLEELDLGGIGVALPTEPLLVGLMVLFFVKLALEPNVLDRRLIRHPITVIILLQVGWMTLCIIPSSMPLVSLKYVLARLWFVSSMYFIMSRLFQDTRNMQRFIWAYLSGLFIVIGYTLIHHSQFGFEHDPAHWVMTPFFKDHTSYGAIIAFFLPFSLGALTMPGYSATRRILAFLMFLTLLTGLIFSYTRAAWLSLLGAIGVFLIVRLKVPVWAMAIGVATLGGLYWANHEQITIALERNREESSDDLGEHVRSISNISSDASNLERINRWNSAMRMFMERPFFGWGPGTYMFQYAPFQASEDRTIISTNFGEGGNAHSEYLGPLSEQGLPGLGLMLALVLVTLVKGMRLFARMPSGVDRRLMMAALLGLVTYYLHGALNNFLDTDKASVPFWAFTLIIVLFDLKYPVGLPSSLPEEGR